MHARKPPLKVHGVTIACRIFGAWLGRGEKQEAGHKVAWLWGAGVILNQKGERASCGAERLALQGLVKCRYDINANSTKLV
jgi:hypothetical protein